MIISICIFVFMYICILIKYNMSLFGNVMCLLYDKLHAFLDASDVLGCSTMSCIDTE